MGQTFVEKVLSRSAKKNIKAGEIAVVEPDFSLATDNTARIARQFNSIGVEKVWDPAKIVVVFDHTVPCSTEEYANSHKIGREFIRSQQIEHFYDLQSCGGVCHQVMCEKGYAAPGLVIVGSDSHTCTSGAMNALAVGIGHTETASIWATGVIWLSCPESIKIVLDGKFKPGVSAKDLILTIIGDLGSDGANYRSIEFHGQGVLDMSIASRMTLCNMAVEAGAKNAVCPPDEKLLSFITPIAKTSHWQPTWADKDAKYFCEMHYDLGDIVPSVAKPHRVDNYSPVSEVAGIPIDQVFIGSCTNARLEDLQAAAALLKGKHVKVRTIVAPASHEILHAALLDGTVTTLVEAGCTIYTPGCACCFGAAGGILADDEICVATSNRNFKGRMGSRSSSLYLASPYTAAASAVAGKLCDPREFFRRDTP